MYVDFDNNREQDDDGGVNDDPDFNQTFENDEPFLAMAPFIAVFDDDEAREMFDTSQWGNVDIRRGDLTEYITQFADRIHFNRYTGVAMK